MKSAASQVELTYTEETSDMSSLFWKRGAAMMGVSIALLTGPSLAANAVEPIAITDVELSPILSTPWQQTAEPTAIPNGTVVTTTVGFSVPATAVSGDTTTLTVPEGLSIAGLAEIPITAPDGAIVATASASESGNALTITYSDYITGHSSVRGEISFQSRVNVPAATESPAPVTFDFTSGGQTFPTTLNVYDITDAGYPGALAIQDGVISGNTITWVYYTATPLGSLDLALMDDATTVDCSNLQLTYRDATYSGGAYPADSAFGAATTPAATCTPDSTGLDAATQVVNVHDAAVVADGTLREFRLVATISDPTQAQFQAVMATKDGGSEAVVYAAGLADRQMNTGTAGGTADGGNTDGGNTDGGGTADGGNTDGGGTADGGNTDGGGTADGGNTDGGNTAAPASGPSVHTGGEVVDGGTAPRLWFGVAGGAALLMAAFGALALRARGKKA